MTNYRTKILTFAVAVLASSAALAQETIFESSLSAVPSNAAAFAHVDFLKLANTPGLSEQAAIINSIKTEADEVFVKHVGVRISELKDATFVVTSLDDRAMNSFADTGNPESFGLFCFSNPVDEGFVEKHLPRTWRPTKIGKQMIFVDKMSDMAVFHSSPNMIAFGSETGVRWFLKYRGNRVENGLRLAMQNTDHGQLAFGFNFDAIPANVKSSAPPELKNFVFAKWATLSLDLSDGVSAKAEVRFTSPSEAVDAEAFAKENLTLLADQLKLVEAGTLFQLKTGTPDLFSASVPLASLAAIRYGSKILGGVELKQDGEALLAQAEVKGFDLHMIVITCLTAIQAVGTVAEAEFQDIASELDGSHGSATATFQNIASELEASK